MKHCPSCDQTIHPNVTGSEDNKWGKLTKRLFIIFNAVMALVVLGGGLANFLWIKSLPSNNQFGLLLGSTIVIVMVLSFWLAGSVILGVLAFLTRKRG